MPKVYKASEFNNKHRKIIDELVNSDENYLIVANEIDKTRTFIVIKPLYLKVLFDKLQDTISSNFVSDILEQITKKISDKYRKMRLSR